MKRAGSNEAAVKAMSPEDVKNFFGEEIITEAMIPPNYDAKNFRAALLTDERLVVYSEMELRHGAKTDFYIFRNPLGARVLVFPADSVLEVDIAGVIDQETLDKAARGRN